MNLVFRGQETKVRPSLVLEHLPQPSSTWAGKTSSQFPVQNSEALTRQASLCLPAAQPGKVV
jgi:hypothetical protein